MGILEWGLLLGHGDYYLPSRRLEKGERGGSTLWYEVSNSRQKEPPFSFLLFHQGRAIGSSKSFCNIVSEKRIFFYNDAKTRTTKKEENSKE
jgi:hypothetical protein